MERLSKTEQTQLVNLLNRLKPGFLPSEIFYAIAKLMVTTTYTIVPLFIDSSKIYVHLTKRENNDPHWAGLLHTPGKVILPNDKTIRDTRNRLYKDEMNNLDILGEPIFCGYIYDEIPRGKEIAMINYILLGLKPVYGELHDVNNLPQNLIPTEIMRIELAVKKFQNKINYIA